MNPEKSPEITVQTLLALRKEDDAVRLITERLRVKEMGRPTTSARSMR